MDPLCLRQLLLRILQLGVVREDALLDLVLALDQLILGRNVLLGELSQINSTVLILVKLVEKLVNYLRPVLIVNTLSGKERVHFISIDFAVAVEVNLGEFLAEPLLFGLLGVIREATLERRSLLLRCHYW